MKYRPSNSATRLSRAQWTAFRLIAAGSALAFFALPGGQVHGADSAQHGEYSSPATWLGGMVPTAGNGDSDVDIENGHVVTVSSGTVGADDRLRVGVDAGLDGTFTIQGGTFIAAGNAGGSTLIGANGGRTGNFNLTSGRGVFNTQNFLVGAADGATGVVLLQSPGALEVGGDFIVGSASGSTGIFNSSGNLETDGDIFLGNSPGSHGTWNYSGGTVQTGLGSLGDNLFVGNQGTGILNVTAGNLNINGSILVGQGSAAGIGEGIVNQSAGLVTTTLDFTDVIIGASGKGEYTITGGKLQPRDDIVVGNRSGTNNAAGTGVLTINGPNAVVQAGNNLDFFTDFIVGNTFDDDNPTDVSHGTVNLDGGLATGYNMQLATRGLGFYNQSGGTMDLLESFIIGDSGSNTLASTTIVSGTGFANISGGVLDIDDALVLGDGNQGATDGIQYQDSRAAFGSMNVSGGIVRLNTASADLINDDSHTEIGFNGTGFLSISGGTLLTNHADAIGVNAPDGDGGEDGVDLRLGVTNALNDDDASLAAGTKVLNTANSAPFGQIDVSAGALIVARNLNAGLGSFATGNVNVSGGILAVDGHIFLADGNDSRSFSSISGGHVEAGVSNRVSGQDDGGNIHVADGLRSSARLDVSGGTITVAEDFIVGFSADSVGTLNLSGGFVKIGEAGTDGMGGGGGEFRLGNNPMATGVLNFSGGTIAGLDLATAFVGVSGTGYANFSGGLWSNQGSLNIAQNRGSFGSVNMTGGVIDLADPIGVQVGGLSVDMSTEVLADDFRLTAQKTLTNFTFWAHANENPLTFPQAFNGTVGWAIYNDVSEQSIYWTDIGSDRIQRSGLDGANVGNLVTTGVPRSFGVFVTDSFIYFTDADTDKVQRANLDGSNVTDLVTGLSDPFGISVTNNFIYWVSRGGDKIQRSNLDGSNVVDLVTGLTDPFGISVTGSFIYWTDVTTVKRSNLDGSNVINLVTGLGSTTGISVTASFVYWADNGTDKIQRANLNGSGVTDLVTGVSVPLGLFVTNSFIYWTDPAAATKLSRANLDGSDVTGLVTGLLTPAGIFVGGPANSVPGTVIATGSDPFAFFNDTGMDAAISDGSGNLVSVWQIEGEFGGAGVMLNPGRYWLALREGSWGSAADPTPIFWRSSVPDFGPPTGTPNGNPGTGLRGSEFRADSNVASPVSWLSALGAGADLSFELRDGPPVVAPLWDNGNFDTSVRDEGDDVIIGVGGDVGLNVPNVTTRAFFHMTGGTIEVDSTFNGQTGNDDTTNRQVRIGLEGGIEAHLYVGGSAYLHGFRLTVGEGSGGNNNNDGDSNNDGVNDDPRPHRAIGVVTVAGGSMVFDGAGNQVTGTGTAMIIGQNDDSSGTYIQTGGRVVLNGDLLIANQGASVLHTDINAAGGNGATRFAAVFGAAEGFFDISGGTLDVGNNSGDNQGSGDDFIVGQRGQGTGIIHGDAFVKVDGSMVLGNLSDTVGTNTVGGGLTGIGDGDGHVTLADNATLTVKNRLQIGNTHHAGQPDDGKTRLIQTGGFLLTSELVTSRIQDGTFTSSGYEFTGGILSHPGIFTGGNDTLIITGDLVLQEKGTLKVSGGFLQTNPTSSAPGFQDFLSGPLGDPFNGIDVQVAEGFRAIDSTPTPAPSPGEEGPEGGGGERPDFSGAGIIDVSGFELPSPNGVDFQSGALWFMAVLAPDGFTGGDDLWADVSLDSTAIINLMAGDAVRLTEFEFENELGLGMTWDPTNQSFYALVNGDGTFDTDVPGLNTLGFDVGIRWAIAAIQGPQNVVASDAAFTNKVEVTWDAVTSATSYEVWRSTVNNASTATHVSSGNDPASTSYDDTTTVVGIVYFYWIKAVLPGDTSAFSSEDTGFVLDPAMDPFYSVPSFQYSYNASHDMELSFATNAGFDYIVQTSTDLVSWTDLMTIRGDGSPVDFLHMGNEGDLERFYRIERIFSEW